MRQLVDEHVARSIVIALRDDGHDVVSVADTARGSSDVANLAMAVRDGRAFLTYDSDYGDLIFHEGLPPPISIVYVRMDPRDIAAIAQRVVAVLRLFPIDGRMLVVERDRVRTRAFASVRRI